MALDANARLLGEATRRVNAAVSNYRSIERQASANFNARSGPQLERFLQTSTSGSFISGGVSIARSVAAGLYTALCQQWGRSLGNAARLVESARNTMVEQARTLESEANGLAGRLASALSRKTADFVATEALAASMADDSASELLQAHQRSRWAANDPAETPLILTGLRLPSDGRAWSQSIYTTLVGEDYARLHPWTPPAFGGNGFSIPWWLPVGGGAAAALWLIWKDISGR